MLRLQRHFAKSNNAFEKLKTTIKGSGSEASFYSLGKLGDKRIETLPYSIRVLLENAVRNNDGFVFTEKTVEDILNWKQKSTEDIEIPFKPSRVLLQDFTGVPAVVDLAAMRDAVCKLGLDYKKINPLCPVDLVVDHSVQVDVARTKDAKKQNELIEFNRNKERFQFLKWGQSAFENFRIIPPGNGIVHQVNLEYLARVVFNRNGLLYPDSVVGTDSHTTMINGLGVVGWGVGGIEAEAVMLGQHISMVLPEVVGFKLTGKLRDFVTATDLVLTITQMLRKRGVVGKFVEFFGDGVENLTVEDRSTVSNMAPEYGATIGIFPQDCRTMDYLIRTGRKKDDVELMRKYLSENKLMRDYVTSNNDGVQWSGEVLSLDLSTVEPSVAGPKRPHDRVSLSNMKQDWKTCMESPVGFKGFGVKAESPKTAKFNFKGTEYTITNGSIVISAITSCTNTSNPGVLVAAGLLAKSAISKGLKIAPYIKTSLSPGSGVVEAYLRKSGLLGSLEEIGFTIAGLGCMTCIGNSGDLDPDLSKAIKDSELVVASVLSGNRNFEGRVHPLTKANYLASPPLCVAYAIAGTVDIDFEKEPIGKDKDGKNVFLKDIWPSNIDISQKISESIDSSMFLSAYADLDKTNQLWNQMPVSEKKTYDWDSKNTYIKNPPFFEQIPTKCGTVEDIKDAHCLLNLGDSITTDHISPAGNISGRSPAAAYLKEHGVQPSDFNTYGARRGNHDVMARGTFANIRLRNKLVGKEGPTTVHVPSGQEGSVFDVAMKYKEAGVPTIVLAGKEYGSGSSRDWAAKGPYLLGIKGVIAKSFERIHRSNLIGCRILPMEFKKGEDADKLGLTGKETFSIEFPNGEIKCKQLLKVKTNTGKEFEVIARLDTPIECEYYKYGGILKYVLAGMFRK